jgi:hypothetical protein
MKSRFTALAVTSIALLALSSLGGCVGRRQLAPSAPTPGVNARVDGYPAAAASPPSEPARPLVESESRRSYASDSDAREEAPRKAMDAPAPPSATATDTLIGSGGAGATSTPPPPPPPLPQGPQPSAAMKPEKKPDATKEPPQNRDFVIYTARFTMAVYLVDQGLAAVEKIAHDNGGYLGQKKDREITVRIPRGRFESTLAAIDKVGDVLHRDVQAEDVTDEHVDLEIRIKNARAMQRRLSDLLSKASVKEALDIEKELHRVTEELERLEGRMKVLKDRIAFSTITVAFEPRGTTIQTTNVRLPFPWLGALNLPSLLSLYEEK